MNNFKVEVKNDEGIKLTRKQKRVVVQIMKGHLEDQNYYFSDAILRIGKYFTSVYFYYYPITAVDNPYVARVKNFWIGPKGAIQRATSKFGIGKDHDIKKVAHYYFKASEG